MKRHRPVTPATALAALATLALLAPSVAAAGPPARGQLRVAVMDFAPASAGDAEVGSLGKGLASMITTDLAGIEGVELIERARLEDVKGELRLGASGAVDAKTAARVGKLLAASHLVLGTVTVAGAKMRLDARLVSVKDGKVALAAEAEGERDAFFELEKGLVTRLVGGLGVELAPKERARLAKIHTADFEAFRAYSVGLDRFDQRDYDAAVAALKQATTRDADFQLATLTLGEYERIVAELRTRADTLTTARAEAERLERLAERSDEARVVERLFSVVQDEARARDRERLAALHALAVAYLNLGSNQGKLSKLRATEDRFTMLRTGEALAKRYFAVAEPAFPQVPACLDDRFYASLPEAPDAFDPWLARQVKLVWGDPKDHPDNRKNALADNARPHTVREMARLTHLDRAAAAALQERLYQRLKPLGPGDYTLTEIEEALAQDWRAVLDLDKATAYLRLLAARATSPHLVKQYADAIDTHRAMAEALAATGPLRPWLEEALAHLGPEHYLWRKQGAAPYRGDTLPADVLAVLAKDRQLDAWSYGGGFGRRDAHALVGAHPVWLLQSGGQVVTGRRAPDGRAVGLRSYTREPGDERLGFLIVDGAPRDALTARFTVDHRPAADWWPPGAPRDAKRLSDVPLVSDRPRVAFAFAVNDIDIAAEERLPPGAAPGARPERVVTRPMRFVAVVLDGDRVRLVRATEAGRVTFGRKSGFKTEVLGEARVSWPKGAVPVEVAISADATRVSVAGKVVTLPAAPERQGLYGFWLDGPGYVGLDGLEIR